VARIILAMFMRARRARPGEQTKRCEIAHPT
jgi:hypothetical protein